MSSHTEGTIAVVLWITAIAVIFSALASGPTVPNETVFVRCWCGLGVMVIGLVFVIVAVN